MQPVEETPGTEDGAMAAEAPAEPSVQLEAFGTPADPSAESTASEEAVQADEVILRGEEEADATANRGAEQTMVPAQPPVVPSVDGPGTGALLAAVLVVALVLLGLRRLLTSPGPAALPDGEATPALTEASEDAGQITDTAPAPPAGVVGQLRVALARSRAVLQGQFDALFGGGAIDDSLFEALEETMLKADVGLPTTEKLLAPLRAMAREGEPEPEMLREALRSQITELLLRHDPALVALPEEGPLVMLVVGVNGSGKTTTIGKLASRFKEQGHDVLLAAADTYRAAAADQLKVWAQRADVDIVAHDEGSDPGAVVYDALDAARARGRNIVIVDTAGRLQTARPLMEQLEKIRRIIGKKVPGGPHETLLVLDGTMGQNGLSQAQVFHKATPLTGVVVTKLDGTAKGGMVLTLSSELDLPVKFIGTGEAIEDLRPFDPAAFADAVA